MLVTAHAVFVDLQFAAPGVQRRRMVVDLGDRSRNCGHRFEPFRRIGEVDDENGAAGNIVERPSIAMVHWPIGGGVPKVAPGRVGGTEAIKTVSVVDDHERGLCRHAQ
ncbi:hypothetical protein [Dechloromonas sp. HYN0024]|uniref:hypothetical protein n=1 Tax=Dechloromonas sp. HYN0024 TaxID=2231055 RepID=UPI001F0720D4|nr:hypothetical protein [Dechloromonas sp. HYN0024]